MNNLFVKKLIFTFVSLVILTFVTNSWAQKGALRGGSMVLSNGNNSITITPPVSGLTTHTLTLPPTQSAVSTIQWLANNASGVLSWVTAPAGLDGLAVALAAGVPQQTATSSKYLFNMQSLKTGSLSTAVNSATPGAYINSTVNGTSANATGLTVNVANSLATATGVTMTGISMHSGTTVAAGAVKSNNYGLSVNVSGSGTNYAALFTAGNVGFGTATPGESLEVNGNIRISGVKGLKISEGTNGTMGKATLAAGTVVINTSKVTANSRIFLMDQVPNGGTPGTPYVSARTAGTSFTITSTNAGDVSDVAWIIIEP